MPGRVGARAGWLVTRLLSPLQPRGRAEPGESRSDTCEPTVRLRARLLKALESYHGRLERQLASRRKLLRPCESLVSTPAVARPRR